MVIMIICNTYAKFEAEFIKKLSNTEAEFGKSVNCKKAFISFSLTH